MGKLARPALGGVEGGAWRSLRGSVARHAEARPAAAMSSGDMCVRVSLLHTGALPRASDARQRQSCSRQRPIGTSFIGKEVFAESYSSGSRQRVCREPLLALGKKKVAVTASAG